MPPSPRLPRIVARLFACSLLCVIATGAGGCASVPAPEGSTPPAEQVNTRDPFEGFNRAMYAFNDAFDSYLLKPVARVYRFVTPQFVRIGVSNFYSNLRDPGIMVNNLLQGKLVAGASDLGRVAVNTTLGIGGLFDVATHFGLEKHEEDFGQTLAVWGVGEGPYLVLPILGPSNFRDGFGEIPDWYLYPTTYMEEQSTAGKLFVGRLVNRREQLLDATEILEQAAGPDPYVFVREAYRQRRVNLIYDGNPPAPAADPALFDDEPAPGQPK